MVNIGGMENYAEQGTANYGGPRIPTTRYEKVQQCYRFSQTQAKSVLDDALARLVGSAGHARIRKPGRFAFSIRWQLPAGLGNDRRFVSAALGQQRSLARRHRARSSSRRWLATLTPTVR